MDMRCVIFLLLAALLASAKKSSSGTDSGKYSPSDSNEDDSLGDQPSEDDDSVEQPRGNSTEMAPFYEHEDRFKDQYIVRLSDVAAYPRIEEILGARVIQPLMGNFSSFVADLDDEHLLMIRKDEAVAFLEDDEVINITAVASWGLDRIDQRELPLDDVYDPIANGSGVDVYVLDSGININHVDFGGRAEYGIDVFGEDGVDCHGHGTHCAGTVGGIKYGVAKGATIISVRVLNCDGIGYLSGLMKGVDWVISNRSISRPAVASMSIGARASPTLDDLVDKLFSTGVTVATSAGNKNADACNYSPARAGSAITVGATNNQDTRAFFSNYGECVDIFAPGRSILSAGIASADEEKRKSGTSMAAPHVAGAIAILLGLNPDLTPKDVRRELLDRATLDAVSDAGVNSTNALLFVGEFIQTTTQTAWATTSGTDPATLPTTKSTTILTTPGAATNTSMSLACAQSMGPCTTLKVLRGTITKYNGTVPGAEV